MSWYPLILLSIGVFLIGIGLWAIQPPKCGCTKKDLEEFFKKFEKKQ